MWPTVHRQAEVGSVSGHHGYHHHHHVAGGQPTGDVGHAAGGYDMYNEDRDMTSQMVEVPDMHDDSSGIAVASYDNSETGPGDTTDATDSNETVPVIKVMMVNGEVIFHCSIEGSIQEGTR